MKFRSRATPRAGVPDRPATEPEAAAGKGKRDRRSLFGEILDWVLAPLLLVWPISLGLTWLVAQGIAQAPFDQALVQLARNTGSELAELELSSPNASLTRLAVVHAQDIRVQVATSHGELLLGDASVPLPSADLPGGPNPAWGTEVQLRDEEFEGTALRVAAISSQLRNGTRVLVQVAEPLSKRSKLAADIVKGVMLPQFVVLPLAVLLVWMALARGISPLGELQQRIRARDSSDLSPIAEHEAPEELAGVVRALNELLGRLGRSIALQKQFLADAAHQLKTPLAGLNTQAELAQRELAHQPPDAAMVSRSIEHMARSSLNAAHMVNQLLAMARAEDHELAQRMQPVDLSALAREVLQDFVPKAMDRGIDLGFEGNPASLHAATHRAGPGPLRVKGNAVLLRELLCNLVDNALKYSPRGSSATVRVLEDPFGQVVVLQVEDSGPGIPAAEREQVFRPFYRVLGTGVDGSGLGLAIVQEIARSHLAELTVGDAHPGARAKTAPGNGGPGTVFTLRFAASPEAQPPGEAEAPPSAAAVDAPSHPGDTPADAPRLGAQYGAP
jgi:two-component system sensor histidine kinase TctE